MSNRTASLKETDTAKKSAKKFVSRVTIAARVLHRATKNAISDPNSRISWRSANKKHKLTVKYKPSNPLEEIEKEKAELRNISYRAFFLGEMMAGDVEKEKLNSKEDLKLFEEYSKIDKKEQKAELEKLKKKMFKPAL